MPARKKSADPPKPAAPPAGEVVRAKAEPMVSTGKAIRHDMIRVRGARHNNLRSIDLDIPLGKLNVITGPSGSGKSSLAIQTIYAEGQRRYVETFSPYTRQFFDRMDKPQVEEITGIPPAIAIEQQNSVRTTRSTVGTMTEINDYLKLLFPRLAVGQCPGCGQEVKPDTAASIAQAAREIFAGQTVLVTIPVPCPTGANPAEFFDFLASQGYLRVWLFGETFRTDEPEKYTRKTLPAIVPVIQDRLKISGPVARLSEALEVAFRLGKGKLSLIEPDSGKSRAFSSGWHCAECDITLRPPIPSLFSFNNPLGACPECRGFGRTIGIDLNRAMPDKSLSIREGLIKAFSGQVFYESQHDLEKCAKREGISLTTPFDELPAEEQKWVIEGDPNYRSDPESAWESKQWYGVKGFFDYVEKRSYKMHFRVFLSRFRSYTTCRRCNGARLQPEALVFRVNGQTLPDWMLLPVKDLAPLIESLKLPAHDSTAELLQTEVASRLRYLDQVGLGYLSLDRSTRTLSGGETERVNLTTCLGASLVNTLFVLDEPSVGLHPRDTGKLIEVMRQLTRRGNTLLVVEHEESIIRAADNLIDIGPGRGEEGGQLVFNGPPHKLPKLPGKSLTADYLRGIKWVPIPEARRPFNAKNVLKILRASSNNLRKLDVTIPLGLLVCVTGVSGSGKSTLVHDVLYENLLRLKGGSSENESGYCKEIQGADKIEQVILVDQNPLSRTPRSTPAVYLGAFEFIRQIFSETPDAEADELTAGYFSFNSGNGRCPRCSGTGFEKVEMQFLSDLYVKCPECDGRRYKPEALRIRCDGLNIADVLDLTVTEAVEFFSRREDDPKFGKVSDLLRRLGSVGLGYLRLGQPVNTLSGGESQRLKLVGHMLENDRQGKRQKSLLIFDEPTTGLHFDDIALLLEVFQELVEHGNSLLIVEHNTDVIRAADWIIDLGPEAGADGGQIVIAGTPEEVAECEASHTGRFLKLLETPPALVEQTRPKADLENGAEYSNNIQIHGAREHNLKNIDVTIPRDQFVVVTGLSGSGKSTLAFDLVFAEGQRRFLDSMSTYARQFVEQMERPDVDHISGLPPTVAIEQRITRGGVKSTVATVTEVYHFLRLLFSKLGTQYCPDCDVPVKEQSASSIARIIGERAAVAKRGPIRLMAPVIRGRKGFHDKIAALARRQGCEEMFIDGKVVHVDNFQRLKRFQEHSIDLIVGAIDETTKPKQIELLTARALDLGRGVLRIVDKMNLPEVFSTQRTCPECSRSFDILDPRLFSFNSPTGWCPECRGHGRVKVGGNADLDASRFNSLMEAELVEDQRMEHADPDELVLCKCCQGTRLNQEANHVRVQDMTIGELCGRSVTDGRASVLKMKFAGSQELIAQDIRTEIGQRLKFLEEVGLGYLSLNRGATTLSGGESQRIRLAAQLGSNLSGVLYVLDEPTIGLHPRDNEKLLSTLVALRDKGNSLLIVEHDEETMLQADHVIDLGPGAGRFGGQIVSQGSPKHVSNDPNSVTGPYISMATAPKEYKRRKLPAAKAKEGWLRLKGAVANNLKKVEVAFPIGRLTVLTGISGSGKSSLMRGCLMPAVVEALAKPSTNRSNKSHKTYSKKKQYEILTGAEALEAVYEVDQSPIGKTSRSTPATYLKIFDDIRSLFAATPTARARGFTASRFSFNTEGGRCETCGGNGSIKHEMTFLPSSYTQCDDCQGLRYNAATLEIDYNGKNIGDVCQMSIDEAADFFTSHPKLRRTLRLLRETGLGYLQLGQASPTLSGGEAQRIKLVAELSRGESRAETTRLRKNQTPKSNLYLIEEPTIGLHPADVQKLLHLIQRLVDDGQTVVIIEHHLDLIASADYLVDIGPEAGEEGGTVVSTGTPEEVAQSKVSRTAPFLKKMLKTPLPQRRRGATNQAGD